MFTICRLLPLFNLHPKKTYTTTGGTGIRRGLLSIMDYMSQDALPKMGALFRLEAYKKVVRISLVMVRYRKGKAKLS